jgi:Flp pilus assembly protein TadG
MILGLALVPIMTMVGAAVDYTVANERKTLFQSAADSAALAGVKRINAGSAAVEAAIRAWLDANLPAEFRGVPSTYTISADRRTLDVEITASVPTRFLGLIGYPYLDVAAASQATIGLDNAEVVLALDTTGTMRTHIPALQQGARDLVRVLQDAATTPGSLRIGLVPYVAAVNVGNHPDRMS